jgi:hypothetical protein
MTNATLADFIKDLSRSAEGAWAKLAKPNSKKIVIAKYYIACTADGDTHREPIPNIMDETAHDIYVAGLRSLFKANGVVRYAVVNEVWLADTPSLADDPKPEDALCIYAEDASGSLFGIRKIIRAQGKPPRLDKLDIMTGTTGRYCGLLIESWK